MAHSDDPRVREGQPLDRRGFLRVAAGLGVGALAVGCGPAAREDAPTPPAPAPAPATAASPTAAPEIQRYVSLGRTGLRIFSSR